MDLWRLESDKAGYLFLAFLGCHQVHATTLTARFRIYRLQIAKEGSLGEI